MQVSAPVSVGELIDKITILEIKLEAIADEAKRANVAAELELLCGVRDQAMPPGEELDRLTARLGEVNRQLWRIEDEIRDCERAGDFGRRFVALARSVYRTNDRRAEIKREINAATGSVLVEEKSYSAY